uniref:Solute:Na+ symporter, SSS family n=1 Tax=Candidatus Kentrum sp. TUN TaxID=2126343 RepID=A0A450ZF24_9GAMM|nr:MAG: solute:Na+ symporter, SSS family [Candidatus Kentron sp. TUN]VFK52919.1 MAG: solute:Na+ symporter, SSS family [Candidatus Kentron sp. TUN]VFK62643.1 MAG: solute:Na+ symporter, SSS family [Candidatus Kentron sp. TUN]
MDFLISDIDISIVIGYLVVVMIIGLWVSGKTRSGDDLFLAGRKLGWPAIGFSLFASNISSTTLIGLAGAAYIWGIAVSNYEWMAAIVLGLGCIIIIPLYLQAGVTTVPEFLEYRFDRRSRYYFSGITLVANVFIDTAGTLFAGAMVLKVFFPEIDLFTACVMLALFAGIYTAAGGLAAVVYTDVIQAVILLIGSCFVTWYTFAQVDFSWAYVVTHTDPDQLSLFLPNSDPNLPWLGALTGVPILGFYFWCTNQFITQRMLGAKNLQNARWGAIFAGFLKLTVLFIMVIPGVIASVFMPGLENSDMVFPTLIKTLLPVGIMGIVLAALLAAIMSSIDSTLNSAATLMTVDFIKPNTRNMSDTTIMWVGRGAIIVFMIIAVSFAPMIANFEGLFNYLQVVLSYLMPPMAVLFSVGVLWKRGTPTGAFASLIITHAISVAIFLSNVVFEIIHIHFTVIAGILFLVGSVVFLIMSELTRPVHGKYDNNRYTFNRTMLKDLPGTPLWKNYLFLITVMLIATLMVVIPFY